jgi:hypothetical protein
MLPELAEALPSAGVPLWLQERLDIPADEQVITTLGGRPLRPSGASLYDQGVRQYDTLELSARLGGGQPVKVGDSTHEGSPARCRESVSGSPFCQPGPLQDCGGGGAEDD